MPSPLGLEALASRSRRWREAAVYLCFWATQTAGAALDLCVGARRPTFTPCLPPHTAATVIQHAYHSYIDHEWEWWQKLSWAGYALEREMNPAMHDLRHSDNFVFLVCDGYWIRCLDNGWACWMPGETCLLPKLSSSGLPFLVSFFWRCVVFASLSFGSWLGTFGLPLLFSSPLLFGLWHMKVWGGVIVDLTLRQTLI